LLNETIDWRRERNVQLKQIESLLKGWILGNQCFLRFFAKFEVSAGHYEMVILCGQVVYDRETYSFVCSCYDDFFELLHILVFIIWIKGEKNFRNNKIKSDWNLSLREILEIF
jgi:hypothetical protein